MDEKSLKVFMTVVRTKSLNKAADELGYTQPGLTQMINRLENDLGCHVLTRSHSGVQLTVEGERLLPLFQNAANAMELIQNEAGQLRGQQNPVIRIGAYPSAMKVLLPSLIRKYQEKRPNAVIEISVGSYNIRDWLNSGTVDLGFVDESIRGDYIWLPLLEDPYYAAVPANCQLSREKSVSIDQLSAYPFILSQINELKPLGQLKGIREKLHIDAADDASLLSLIEQGLGVTVLPASSLTGHSGKVQVLALNPPMKRMLGISHTKSASQAALAFASFAKRECALGSSEYLQKPSQDTD